MLNAVFTDPNDALLTDRLNQVAIALRALTFPTEEEYQAAVYSAVNAVLSLGNAMHPISIPVPQGPAIVGDVTTNLTQISSDFNDIVNEVQRVEGIAASLYNQTAASQNELRQSIRENVYASSVRSYIEQFINSNQISSTTANIDVNAGVATSTIISQTQLSLTPSLGQNSVGTLDPTTPISNLVDGDPNTLITFNGSSIELLFSSDSSLILNRLVLDLDTYDPLEITVFTTSPDGSLVEDILGDLNESTVLMDGLSGKFSGDVIIDFPPCQVKSVRLIIQDRIGTNLISLRGIEFWSNRYSATSQITSVQINSLNNTINFAEDSIVVDPYVSITHQLSYDSVQFFSVNPGLITLTQSPFWYKALFNRNSAQFQSGALSTSNLDPSQSSNYVLTSSTSTPKGGDVTERDLSFTSVTGPITLRETPIPNTLVIQQGAIILTLGVDYSFSNNIIALAGSGSISISYQTSSAGVSSLTDREEYYSPYLYSVTFSQR